MPLRSIAAVGEDLVAATKINQLEQLHAITSILDDARNLEKFSKLGNPVFTKSFKNEYIISFENFSMIPFDPDSESDYQDYKAIVADAEIMKTVSVFNCGVPNESEARKAYQALTEINHISQAPLSYKVIANDGEVMGLIMPAILQKHENKKASVLDFGCLFKKKYRGNAALIVCSAIAKQSFQVPEITKLVTSALSNNYNPQAIFLRLGFEFVGQTRKKGNEDHIINVFELTRERFNSGKSREVKIRDIRSYIDQISSNFSGGNFLKPFCVRT